MIVTIFLTIIYYALRLLVTPLLLLPSVTAESGVGLAISTLAGYLASLADFLPVYTLISIVLIVLSIELGVGIYKLIMWGLRRLPTQS